MNDYNPYIRHISKIEYFAKHIEIDAFVNGAYYTVEEEPITTFDSFIEKTELKHIKNSLLEAYSFFNSVKFDGIFQVDIIKRGTNLFGNTKLTGVPFINYYKIEKWVFTTLIVVACSFLFLLLKYHKDIFSHF